MVSPSEPWEKPTLPALGFGSPGLLDRGRVHFCSLEAPVCGPGLWQPQETNAQFLTGALIHSIAALVPTPDP